MAEIYFIGEIAMKKFMLGSLFALLAMGSMACTEDDGGKVKGNCASTDTACIQKCIAACDSSDDTCADSCIDYSAKCNVNDTVCVQECVNLCDSNDNECVRNCVDISTADSGSEDALKESLSGIIPVEVLTILLALLKSGII